MEINLVIKAPNQKVPDQAYTCSAEWTVKQLKEHIAQQYPTKPPIDEQRLIFAGAYLNDEARLAEAVRQRHAQASGANDNELSVQAHTIHLVCTQDAPSKAKGISRMPAFAKPMEPASIVGEDGLRRRINSSGTLPASAAPPLVNSRPPEMNRYQTAPPPFPAWNGGQYRSEAEAQQAYYAAMNWYVEQYRSYYEAYYRSCGWPMPPVNPAATVSETAEGDAPAAAPGVAVPPEPRMAPPNNQMRLDAQGNAFLADDDDEENGGREWDILDWMYTIARMAVFLSIIYFYSNMFRFVVVVFCAFLLQYLHQALRRNPAPVPAPPARLVEQNDNQGVVVEGEQPNNAENDHVDDGRQNEVPGEADLPQLPPREGSSLNAEAVTVTATDDAPRGVFALWAFVTAFFSSLFPEVPAN